jgi:hypothetical protein
LANVLVETAVALIYYEKSIRTVIQALTVIKDCVIGTDYANI